MPKPVEGPGFATLEGPKPAATFDLRETKPTPPPPAPKPVQPRTESIDDVFAGFEAPSREIEPQAGAVDIRKVKPAVPAKDPAQGKETAKDPKGKDAKDTKDTKAKDAKAKEAKDAKSAALANPSRIWVQVATGRDKSALGFDWRKLARENAELFKGLKPSITAWGQANRLLAGPFASQKEAAAFLAKLKKAGVSGAFIWSSPAGQVVDALAAGK